MSARGLRVVRLGPDEVVAKRGVAEVRLRFAGVADLLGRVAELADGAITEAELVGGFEPGLQPEVSRLIGGLRARGLLHDHTAHEPEDLFWLGLQTHAPDAKARLAAASALVIGTGRIADGLAAGLTSCGVGRVDRAPATGTSTGTSPGTSQGTSQGTSPGTSPTGTETWDLWCAASDGPEPDGPVTAAEAALAAGAVFLPVWLDDLVIRVGPLTHPFDTACLRCYRLRVDANDAQREVHRLLRGQDADGYSGAGFLPPMTAVAGQVGAVEAVKHLSGLPATTTGRVIELSLVPFRCDVRRVLRVPRCPACSGVAHQGAPVVAHGSQLAE